MRNLTRQIQVQRNRLSNIRKTITLDLNLPCELHHKNLPLAEIQAYPNPNPNPNRLEIWGGQSCPVCVKQNLLAHLIGPLKMISPSPVISVLVAAQFLNRRLDMVLSYFPSTLSS
eukprot:scaffold1064_cov142-Ochromonas_danica.AAC.4